jgi:hypothetical protein
MHGEEEWVQNIVGKYEGTDRIVVTGVEVEVTIILKVILTK